MSTSMTINVFGKIADLKKERLNVESALVMADATVKRLEIARTPAPLDLDRAKKWSTTLQNKLSKLNTQIGFLEKNTADIVRAAHNGQTKSGKRIRL